MVGTIPVDRVGLLMRRIPHMLTAVVPWTPRAMLSGRVDRSHRRRRGRAGQRGPVGQARHTVDETKSAGPGAVAVQKR